MKVIVKEMKDGKKTHIFKSEALNRLIAVRVSVVSRVLVHMLA